MRPATNLRNESALAFLATGTQGAARFLTSWLVGRLGGAVALGTMMSGFALAQFLAILGPQPAGTAASKFGSAENASKMNDNEYDGATLHVAIRVLQVLPLLCIASVAFAMVGYQATLLEALCVSASLFGLCVAALGKGILYGQRKIPAAVAVEIALATVSVIALLAFLYVGVRGLYLLLPLAASQLLFLPVIVASVDRIPASDKVRREIDKFLFYGVLGSLASAGFLHITLVIVRIVGGEVQAGYFSGAVAIASPILLITTTFTQVFYPRLSQSWTMKDLGTYRSITDRFTRAVSAAIFLPLSCLVVFGSEVISLLWGPSFSETGRLLPLIVVAVLLRGLTAVSVASLTAGPAWGMKFSARSSMLGAVVGLAVTLPSVLFFGAFGGALGYLVGSAVVAILPFIAAWKRGKYSWGHLTVRYLAGIGLIGIILVCKGSMGSVWPTVCLIAVWFIVALPDFRRIVA